jgi:hypothetical protein
MEVLPEERAGNLPSRTWGIMGEYIYGKTRKSHTMLLDLIGQIFRGMRDAAHMLLIDRDM